MDPSCEVTLLKLSIILWEWKPCGSYNFGFHTSFLLVQILPQQRKLFDALKYKTFLSSSCETIVPSILSKLESTKHILHITNRVNIFFLLFFCCWCLKFITLYSSYALPSCRGTSHLCCSELVLLYNVYVRNFIHSQFRGNIVKA